MNARALLDAMRLELRAGVADDEAASACGIVARGCGEDPCDWPCQCVTCKEARITAAKAILTAREARIAVNTAWACAGGAPW